MQTNTIPQLIKNEKVKVAIRLRPFTEDEINIDATTPIEIYDTTTKQITSIYYIILNFHSTI
jgi:hypothetical protein